MLTGLSDLDDVDAVNAADVARDLHSVARAGAQVRSVAEAQREGVLETLAELHPRSVVIICEVGSAWRAAQFVIAAYAAAVDVPLVCTATLPSWVGPLDVVVVCGDDAAAPGLPDAIARAGRRSAEVVIGCPVEGPVREVATGAMVDLSPRVMVPRRFRFVGHVAVLLAVLAALRRVRVSEPLPDLDALADALDIEAARNSPANETFRNDAKLLATRLAQRPVVWAGDGPPAVGIAACAAAVAATTAGVVSTPVALGEAVETFSGLQMRGGAAAAADSIFYDPQIDGPAAASPQLVAICTTDREWVVRQQVSALTDVYVMTSAGGDDPETPASASGGGWASELILLESRIEMASVYLELMGAQG